LHWSEITIDSFPDLETAMFIRDSETPYCELAVNGIDNLSLSGICNTEAEEIGYYIRTTFPNVFDGSTWCFNLPADFSESGFVLLDGDLTTSAESITSDG